MKGRGGVRIGENDCRKRVANGLRVYDWRLKTQGAWRESLKKVKAARHAGWGVVERVPKTAPKGAVFCRLTAGTETDAVVLPIMLEQTSRTTKSRDERGKVLKVTEL